MTTTYMTAAYDINAVVSDLVSSTWQAWERGEDPDRIAILARHGIQVPDELGPAEEFGLLDALDFLGISVTHYDDFSSFDIRRLSPEVQAQLDELID